MAVPCWGICKSEDVWDPRWNEGLKAYLQNGAKWLETRLMVPKLKTSQEQKSRCIMCRTKYPLDTKEGRKEEVKRLRHWVKKGKTWAQSMLGQRYRDGVGVKQDEKRAAVLFNLALCGLCFSNVLC